MNLALSSTTRLPRFAPLPESVEGALRLLDEATPAWVDIAALAARDVAFSHGLVTARPLSREEWGTELVPCLARRLEDLGTDLLRAWLLPSDAAASPAARRRLAQQSLLAAECALHLAIETAYPRPQEAFLAALFHDLGQFWLLEAHPDYGDLCTGDIAESILVAEERRRYGVDHTSLSTRLALDWGAPPIVEDAIALHHGLEEQVAAAHPLARLLWVADALSSPDHQSLLGPASRLSGLGEAALLALRTDVAYLAFRGPGGPAGGQTANGSLPAPAFKTAGDVSEGAALSVTASPVSAPWRTAALQGLIRSGFTGITADQACLRLDMGARLLFGRRAPFIVSVEADQQLQAAPCARHHESISHFNEMALRLDDEASVVALAARTGATTSHFPGPNGPGRSPRDWHLARWLGTPGLLCLPTRMGPERYVAVFGIDEHLESAAPEQSLMAVLAAAAAGVLVGENRATTQAAAIRGEVEQRYREHARRVIHEASNPLTIIRSYLGVIGQRMHGDANLQGELSILNKELDRVGNLMRSITAAPERSQEPPWASAAEVLMEMRTLYGEALFSQRGIDLDLRTASRLPPVRMPASALKQVLLNLFRNASEALHEGGKLTITTPGVVAADGGPCVEIRLIDNGPGISPERLASLFSPQSSQKADHQGVGLSIVRELLAQHHAHIICRSHPGVGTSFQIFIPLDQKS
ncbi:MAG: ATP-binding protein [Rhodocyclaceae bacterium]|jgi:signal transduction histidine kinase|nr:ATP-binding protein [Rhodocyclaceae bacterium]